MATETHGSETLEAGIEVAVGAPPGMPQLDFSTFANQIFWLLVALVAIYFILSRVALPRIAAILAERKGTITNDLVAAQDLRDAAEKAEAAYEKALADARAEAQAIAARTKAEIQADLDKAIAKADAEIALKTEEGEKAIAEIRAGAMASVEEIARDTAREIVSVLGGRADDGAVADAVSAHLKG